MSSASIDSVVHIIPQLRLGAGRYVVDTALEQARSGWRVAVALGTDAGGEWTSSDQLADELRQAGIAVLDGGDIFHRSLEGLIAAAKSLGAVLPHGMRDGVAHAHTAMAAAVARWAGFPSVVATCHGWNLARDRAYDLQDALAFQSVDAITSPSRHWAAALESMGLHDVAVIPVGLDLRRYAAVSDERQIRPARSIVTVGELTQRKGMTDLVEAMPAVWQQAPDVEWHVFGDGDQRQVLEARAAELDPGQRRIVFHGFVDSPYDRLSRHDLFCLPSRSDNFPVALMEAMLARLPIVATAVGGIPELVSESGCGRVVAPQSPHALASAILEVLQAPGARRAELGRRGEAFIRERCSIEATVKLMNALYTSAVARTRGRMAPRTGDA